MRKLLLFLLTFSWLISANAQKSEATIKGKLVDTAARQPIADATISVINTSDSSLVTFTLTNKQGVFEVRGLEPGNYQLVISHQAFVLVKKVVTVTADKNQFDLGDLAMNKDIRALGEVVVTSNVPIVVKGDTVQFNADAFKTKPNATAEDLLKKLPGVEVDKEGNVKAQGEQVQKVYVDGKEFFWQ